MGHERLHHESTATRQRATKPSANEIPKLLHTRRKSFRDITFRSQNRVARNFSLTRASAQMFSLSLVGNSGENSGRSGIR